MNVVGRNCTITQYVGIVFSKYRKYQCWLLKLISVPSFVLNLNLNLNFEFVSNRKLDNTLTCVTDPGVSGLQGPVKIVFEDDGIEMSAQNFSYRDDPVITSIDRFRTVVRYVWWMGFRRGGGRF